MANINENYLNLQGSYLFANIAKSSGLPSSSSRC